MERLQSEGLEIGAPKADDDDWDAKLALLEADPPAVVSFTFGCPAPDVLGVASEAWVTVTSPEEARGAAEAGASALVVQGAEAGGHRGSWVDTPDLEPIGLHALLQLIDVDVPLVASGGIATAAAVQAALALGASAAQVGTAFLRAPEAGTSQAHRDALAIRHADRAHARVQRPARARHPQPLPGRAPATRRSPTPRSTTSPRPCARRRARTATRS